MQSGLFIPDMLRVGNVYYSYSYPAAQTQPEPVDELLEQLKREYPWTFNEDYHDRQ